MIPDRPASDPAYAEKLERSNREAQLLAAIYRLEKDGDTPYLALELVEADDLTVCR